MAKAIWKNQVIAESPSTEIVEGNHYFPPESIKKEFFEESSLNTHCPWKGTANYYTLVVDGEKNEDAAWYYPSTKDGAKNIEGFVAFWRGVKVEA